MTRSNLAPVTIELVKEVRNDLKRKMTQHHRWDEPDRLMDREYSTCARCGAVRWRPASWAIVATNMIVDAPRSDRAGWWLEDDASSVCLFEEVEESARGGETNE